MKWFFFIKFPIASQSKVERLFKSKIKELFYLLCVCLHFFRSSRPYMDMVFPYKSEANLKVHTWSWRTKKDMQRKRQGYANRDILQFDNASIYVQFDVTFILFFDIFFFFIPHHIRGFPWLVKNIPTSLRTSWTIFLITKRL